MFAVIYQTAEASIRVVVILFFQLLSCCSQGNWNWSLDPARPTPKCEWVSCHINRL